MLVQRFGAWVNLRRELQKQQERVLQRQNRGQKHKGLTWSEAEVKKLQGQGEGGSKTANQHRVDKVSSQP